jgi:hypothetical protein
MVAFNVRELCGWIEDKPGIRKYAGQVGSLGAVASDLIGGEQRTTLLFLPLLKHHPKWRRGSQGIGSCVGWGAEWCATSLMAVEAELGTARFVGEAATEPIYGGCRVESLNKKAGGWSDGAFGYAAAKWLREYGVLIREDYSKQTGNPEHNLTKYVVKKEKDWGNYGCGGQNDKGKLDEVARMHPIKNVSQVNTVEEAIAAVSNWYPISIASMAGFGEMRRDANGIVKRVGQWAHQMAIGGIRWRNGKPEFRCVQSWGDSCSGPDPGIEEAIAAVPNLRIQQPKSLILPDIEFTYTATLKDWNPISACSWWITEADMAWILKTGDCWTYSGVHGFEPRTLDTKKALLDRLR